LTTSEKAKQSLESLGFVNPYEDNQVIAVGENLVGKMGWGYVNITVEKNNNGVGQIDVLSDNLSDPVSFKKLWRRYSPELIIKTYGKPSRIWLGLWPDVPPGGPDRKYELLLFYDSERFLLFYAGNTNFEYGYMCPSYADNGNLEARFGMWLSTADSKVSLENLPGVWIGPVPDYRPIEDVSGLSVTEFYARMLQQKEDFCFRVPADKWP
jgi:hypothetical protein